MINLGNKKDELNITNSHQNPTIIPSNRDLICFAIGPIGIFAISVFLSSFLLIYGVSILGLPALFIGTIYSVSQIIYAIFLPIFGSLSDYMRNHKIGTRNPLIIIGIPLIILVYYLFWNITPSTQYGVVDFTSAIGFSITLILWRLLMALIWAPYQASIPDLSQNEKIIIKINVYMNIFAYVGQVIGIFLPNIILSQHPIPDSASDDYYWINNPNGIGLQIRLDIQSNLIYLYLLFVFCILITIFLVRIPKSKIFEHSDRQILPKTKKGFREVLKIISREPQSRNIIYLLFSNIFFTITYISTNYILVNLAIYFLKLGSYLYYFSVIVVIISFSSFFLSGFISTKLGLKKALQFCCLLSSLSFFCMFIIFIPISLILIQLIASFFLLIVAFMAGSAGIFFNSLIAKLASSTDLSKDESTSGNYMGLFAAFSVFGNIIAVLMASFFIDMFGSTDLQAYLWIFFICGILQLGVVVLIRKLQIVKN